MVTSIQKGIELRADVAGASVDVVERAMLQPSEHPEPPLRALAVCSETTKMGNRLTAMND